MNDNHKKIKKIYFFLFFFSISYLGLDLNTILSGSSWVFHDPWAWWHQYMQTRRARQLDMFHEIMSFLHYICYNCILPNWYTRYDKLWGQDHFWHVPQPCPDHPNTTIRPARFFGVKFLLGTCAVYKASNINHA